MKMARAAGGVKLSLWSNLKQKAGRMKVINHAGLGIVVDVPKQLASLDTAVRVMHTPYDHAEATAEAVVALDKCIAESRGEVVGGGAPKGKLLGRSRGGAGFESRAGSSPSSGRGDSDSESGSDSDSDSGSDSDSDSDGGDRKEREDEKEGAASGAGASGDAAGVAAEGADASEGKEEGDASGEAIAIASDPVEAAQRYDPSEEACTPEVRERASSEEVGELLRPVGGVVYLELLTLPPPSKSVKKWNLKTVTPLSSDVERRPHPLQGQGASAQAQAIRVKMTLERDFVYPEVLNIAYYDHPAGHWVVIPDAEPSVDPETNVLTVKTTWLRALAIVQPRHLDFPYVHWELRPYAALDAAVTSPPRVSLRLVTPRFVVAIAIEEEFCELMEPRRPELEALLGPDAKKRPGELLHALEAAGISLCPSDNCADAAGMDTPSGERLTPKCRTLEEAVYKDMARMSPSFVFAHSKWNQEQGPGTSVVKVMELLDPSDVTAVSRAAETDWRYAQHKFDDDAPFGAKVQLLSLTESSSAFPTRPQRQQFSSHNFLVNAIRTRVTPEAIDMANAASPLLQDTVYRLLRLARPLSFA
jgi:hypothetical protein